MKIHVFVDDNNNIVSTTPVTISPDSRQALDNGDVVFGNAVSAQEGARTSCYELDTTKDPSLDQIRDVAELHKKYAQAIQSGIAKKL